MLKFLLNLLLQFSKAFYNQKSNFIRKRIFPSLSAQSASSQPAYPASQPSQPHRPPPPPFSLAGRARTRPIPACAALAYLPKADSSSSLCSPATTPSPSVTATWAPPVGFIVSPAPADPGRNFSTPPLPRAAATRLGCPRAFTALPHHTPPLIPFKPSVTGLNTFNGVKAINVGD
jgi:hypothetical protein